MKKKKKKKNLPWFLLIKSLLLNQSLFWGRHIGHWKKDCPKKANKYFVVVIVRMTPHLKMIWFWLLVKN